MEIFKPVALSDGDAARMRDVNDKTAGVQRMVQMFVETGERRMAELQKQGREMFEEFAKTYNLDLKHVVYQPSPDGKNLVPMQVTNS